MAGTRWQIIARSFPAPMARRIVSSKPYSFRIAPISRSSVMIKPSKPRSSRRRSVTTRRESEAAVFFRLEAGIPAVADHHTVDPIGELTEDSQFALHPARRAGPLDHRQVVMGVNRRGGVAGKCLPQLAIPCSRNAPLNAPANRTVSSTSRP